MSKSWVNSGHLKMPSKLVNYVCVYNPHTSYPNMFTVSLSMFVVICIFLSCHHYKESYYEHVCFKKKKVSGCIF